MKVRLHVSYFLAHESSWQIIESEIATLLRMRIVDVVSHIAVGRICAGLPRPVRYV